MASVYVSYRSREQTFVREVVARLATQHDVFTDDDIPAGADWRNLMLDRLRAAEIFLVFASADTAGSDYQNAEIGAARFCARHVDQKLLLPVVIDDVPIPRTLADVDCLIETHRDPGRTADAILAAIDRRAAPIRLFISHSHQDADIASRLVDVVRAGLEVPNGSLRCTAVPGYGLDLGRMAPETLRRELAAAGCVIALLTPNSRTSEWVLFELGATWAHTTSLIPLFAGAAPDVHTPGPLRGATGGQLADPATLDKLIGQLARDLGWRQIHDLPALEKRRDLASYAAAKVFARDPAAEHLAMSFAARRARVGAKQGEIIDYIAFRAAGRPHVPQSELEARFSRIETGLFYRLEQLRLLGFLKRIELAPDGSEFGWALADKYSAEIRL
jgi:hypothetical protein